MFLRLVSAAVLSLGFSASAAANCGPCNNAGHHSSAYSVQTERGVTIMRGNIPNINNPRAALAADRRAAEKRAEAASLRAVRAERAADRARAELAARRAQDFGFGPRYSPRGYAPRGYAPRGYTPRYNSGRYGFGASVSRPFFGKRGRGFRGSKAMSRPVFTRRIRG